MCISHCYAQTNLQLYAQLHQESYSPKDLNHIHLAYEFATELMTCQYRPSGKSFLSHLIGTASILGSLGASKEMMAAGLLHAAYEHGDFGDGGTGISPWKQTQVRLRVGPDTENYIAQYSVFRWNESTIPITQRNFDTMKAFDREILLMRLANELEDLLDHGLVYLPNAPDRIRRYQDLKQEHIDLATQLGYPDLGRELRDAIEDTQRELASHSTAVQNSIQQVWPYTITPHSHRYCILISLRRTLIQATNRVARGWADHLRHTFITRALKSRIARFLKACLSSMRST